MTSPHHRTSGPFAFRGERVVVEVADDVQAVRRCRWPSMEGLEEAVCPVTWAGCSIDALGPSPDGEWLVSSRISGQGEWGYDLFRTSPLSRVAGIAEDRGYTLDLPAFAPDGSRVFGIAARHLDWWWYDDTDTTGEPLTVGWLFSHALPGHEVTWHELTVELPSGWQPERRGLTWRMPRRLAVSDEGVRLVPSGGLPVDIPFPLPSVVRLPTPHPSGQGFL